MIDHFSLHVPLRELPALLSGEYLSEAHFATVWLKLLKWLANASQTAYQVEEGVGSYHLGFAKLLNGGIPESCGSSLSQDKEGNNLKWLILDWF